MKRYMWIVAAPLAAWAQIASVEVSAPPLGYAIDGQAKGLRAISGVVGAAVMGEMVRAGAALESIEIAPNRRYGAAVVEEWETLALLRLDGSVGDVEKTQLPVGRAWFSPGSGTLGVHTGERLETFAVVGGEVERVNSFATGSLNIDRAAIADGGNLAVAMSGGDLYRLGNEPMERIGSGFADFAFVPNSQDLLVLNSEGRLALYRKAESGSVELLGEFPGARAFAVSSGARIVALLAAGELILLERASGATRRVSLENAVVEGIWRAEGGAVFQLNRNAASDIWLIDADAESPRLTVVSRRVEQ